MSIVDFYTQVKALDDKWKAELARVQQECPQDIIKTCAARNDDFRLTLDPLVYQILETRYGDKLNAFWKTYSPPKVSKYSFCIVERRKHPNMWWVLRNLAWAGPDMAVYLFCSDENEAWLREMLGDKAELFNIRVVFKGNPSRERGKKEVDNLMSDWRTYASIPTRYILTLEVDCFLRRKIPSGLFQGAYYGCSYGWDQGHPGGGGLTVRRIDAMVELCKAERPDLETDLAGSQDCWLGTKTLERELDFPPVNKRKELLMENMYVQHPIGVHQFWTFLYNFPLHQKEYSLQYISSMLTLDRL
jgi:hypothetical protein